MYVLKFIHATENCKMSIYTGVTKLYYSIAHIYGKLNANLKNIIL